MSSRSPSSNSFDATADERAAYLKQRRAMAGEAADEPGEGEVEADGENGAANGAANGVTLAPERFAAMQAAEQVILTVSENGSASAPSSYEYRVTGRGGKGIVAMAVNERNGALVASFPVRDSDEIMLVTDGGQLIRVPVAGIRIAGRGTQGRDRVPHRRRGACRRGRPDQRGGRRGGGGGAGDARVARVHAAKAGVLRW